MLDSIVQQPCPVDRGLSNYTVLVKITRAERQSKLLIFDSSVDLYNALSNSSPRRKARPAGLKTPRKNQPAKQTDL